MAIKCSNLVNLTCNCGLFYIIDLTEKIMLGACYQKLFKYPLIFTIQNKVKIYHILWLFIVYFRVGAYV